MASYEVSAAAAVGGVYGIIGPAQTSSDYNSMCAYWDLIDAILGTGSATRAAQVSSSVSGTDAMRAARERYLPKFPEESQTDYDFRAKTAKFTNIFRDIVENLAAKPFSDEARVLDETASPRIKELAENIDGAGNNLHVFAASMFFGGIAYAIDWVLVDYTKDVPVNSTIADEQRLGTRPYWVHIPAKRLLAAYSAMIEGQEQFVHVRIAEDYVERNGYGEVSIRRVRVIDREEIAPGVYGPAIYQVFEAADAPIGSGQWRLVEEGPVSIDVIPLVPFITGRRDGCSWRIIPPMQDAADLQVELFQQESGLKFIKEMTAFPMLAGNGVQPEIGIDGRPAVVPVGPKSVLYAPPGGDGNHGEWRFIEPDATSLRFLADDVKETIQQLRELGRQPLSVQAGGITVITARMNAEKANSAIQAWALGLKDAIENALLYTVMWLNETQEPEFSISTDFDVGLNDEKGPETLLAMRAAGDLSQATLWHEMRRRGILSPEFDPDAEEQALAEEVPGEPTPEEIAAMMA